MLDLQRHASLGAALREATQRHADLTCLIEANRERENGRLTYREFAEAAAPLAATLQARGFQAGERAAIIMTNQSKWPIAAHAVFYGGGVLVPLDYKLTPAELLALMEHCRPAVLITEFPIWRALSAADGLDTAGPRTVVVTEAPPAADLGAAVRWERCSSDQLPRFVERCRQDTACIVYSSGTGGRPKGCMLTHDCYLQQAVSLMQLYTFGPGDRYLSILPTNHAIDFMVGFIGPFVCGATVVHLRTLRPEYIREAFTRYRINYMALVPMILKSLQTGLQQRFESLSPPRRALLHALVACNRRLTRTRPRLALSRRLLPQIHAAFGGGLKALFVGGAFSDPQTLQFFYDLGIQVINGYGLTEAGTAVTLNDLRPFRADTVGRALPGAEIRILEPDDHGVGEVALRGPTLMQGYLDDAELTRQTIVDGWLMTGDLGRLDHDDHLQLVGRKRNMIVTPGGKNIYPEDIENALEGLAVKEFCIFAADYIWPRRGLAGEQLVVVLHLDAGATEIAPALLDDLQVRNRRLLDFKRISGCVLWNRDFPRTASMKIKRQALAEAIAMSCNREEAVIAL